jgi:hypothetical protein
MLAWTVVAVIVAYNVGKHFAEKRASKLGKNGKANTAKFVIGDLVRIKGESHEWAIVQKLDDKKVLLNYNEDGMDYEPLLVVKEKDLELA